MLDALPLSPKQIKSIVESLDCRLSIWNGAVRSGKTVASLIAFMIAVRNAPPSGLIIIAGRTLQTIERNILEPLQDPELMGALAGAVQHTRGSTTAMVLGRTVHLIGAADARAEGKLRGLTAGLALVDEATLLPEDFFRQLLARLSVAGARCMVTTNPGSPAHWLKTEFLNREDELDLRSWHFVMDDNPSLDPAYVEALKAEYTGLWYRRFILGEWVAAAGAVYDMWDPAKHVIPWESMPPMRSMLAVSIDFGTQHATAAIALGLGYDNRLYFMDELRIDVAVNVARQSPSQQSRAVREWLAQPHHPEQTTLRPEWVIVDTAAADFRQELFHDGLATQGAKKDVLYGIGLVSSLLQRGLLKVTDRCPGWIAEVTDYVWDTKASERGEDQPDKAKAKDDSLDAGRYAISTTESLWRGLLAA